MPSGWESVDAKLGTDLGRGCRALKVQKEFGTALNL